MKVTRKHFLSAVASAAVGAALSPARLFAAEPRQKVVLSNRFERAIGSSFRIKASQGDTVEVRLERVETRRSDASTSQFSLEFVAPAGERLQEKAYTFEHDRLGELPIFITQTRQDAAGGIWYRADFNLLTR